MKTLNQTSIQKRNLKDVISSLRKNQILDLSEMRLIRGGEGEGSGHEPIIIIPPIEGNG